MSNTFSFNRFLKFLGYDLRSAHNNVGLTLYLAGAIPIISFTITQLFLLILGGGVEPLGSPGKITPIIVALTLVTLIFPEKHYGRITDKKYGSSLIMIPASVTEKWLSMITVSCIIVPAVLFAELFVSDALLSLAFKGTYGASAFGIIANGLKELTREFYPAYPGGIRVNWGVMIYFSFCLNMLFFTLGCIFFEKSKIGKTFLTGFCITLIFMLLILALSRIFGEVEFAFYEEDLSDEAGMRLFAAVLYGACLIQFAVYDLLIFLRIKTIKQ